jgi:hypothetical protein
VKKDTKLYQPRSDAQCPTKKNANTLKIPCKFQSFRYKSASNCGPPYEEVWIRNTGNETSKNQCNQYKFGCNMPKNNKGPALKPFLSESMMVTVSIDPGTRDPENPITKAIAVNRINSIN